MLPKPPACLASSANVGKHLRDLFQAQREATEHLLGDLRFSIKRWLDTIGSGPEATESKRRLRQIESALEAYRSAEAKVEVLLSHYQ